MKLCSHTYVCLESWDTSLLSRDGVFFIGLPNEATLNPVASHLHTVTEGQDLDQLLPGSRPSIQGTEVTAHKDCKSIRKTLLKSNLIVQIRKSHAVKNDSSPHEWGLSDPYHCLVLNFTEIKRRMTWLLRDIAWVILNFDPWAWIRSHCSLGISLPIVNLILVIRLPDCAWE